MPKGKLIAFLNPVDAESDAAFNEWYDKVHIPEVLATGHFTGAQRYRISKMGPDGIEPLESTAPGAYAAVYEIDSPDPVPEVVGKLMSSAGSMQMSDAIAPGSTAFLYEQIGDWTP